MRLSGLPESHAIIRRGAYNTCILETQVKTCPNFALRATLGRPGDADKPNLALPAGALAKAGVKEARGVLDAWILARTKQLENDVVAAMDKYQVDRAARAFVPFVDDLSNWYVRRSRDRFQHAATAEEREGAFATLHEVLVRTAKLLAPFMPFVTEAMYQNLAGSESVHLEQLSEVEKLSAEEEKLLANMAVIREHVAKGLAARAAEGHKVRQPLDKLLIKKDEASQQISAELWAIDTAELNLKGHEFVDELPSEPPWQNILAGATASAFSTALTPQLEREGLAREIIRRRQVLRREAGFALNDRITLVFATDSPELQRVLDEHQQFILDVLQADEILESVATEDAALDVTIEGQKLHLAVLKR